MVRPKPPTPSDEALLIEYQTCQSHNNALGTEFWAITGITMSISTVLWGGLAYAVISHNLVLDLATRFLITFLGAGTIVILALVLFWLKRLQFITYIHHDRMREIEDNLFMGKNWLVRGLDLNHQNRLNQVPARVRSKIRNLSNSYPSLKFWNIKPQFFSRYEYPFGRLVVPLIFSTVILFWIVFILMTWLVFDGYRG